MIKAQTYGKLGGLALFVVLLAGCTENSEVTERDDTELVAIEAGESKEYKLFLREGDELRYEWTAGRPVFYDFHGDRDGASSDEFTSHKAGTLASDGGTFVAPFTGRHGWYWQNDHSSRVVVTLDTSGTYSIVGYV